jgi:uncharacterized protein YecE (DUF72 family)
MAEPSGKLPAMCFGVAGWSYDDWRGIVYPRGCKDTLRAVAQQVGLIEINSTFYALPQARNANSWVERTAEFGTWFTAKLPQQFTHERRCDVELVQQTVDGFAPLLASGRLRGLLAQFSHEFAAGAPAYQHLERLAAAFAGSVPLFVELRHASWNAATALAVPRQCGLGVLALDYPGMVGGFSHDLPEALPACGTAYLRLHGRNRAWFRRGASRNEVYDWLYSPDELRQIEARLVRIGAQAKSTLVVANNHFHGKAMKVVEELLAWYRELAVQPGVHE